MLYMYALADSSLAMFFHVFGHPVFPLHTFKL